MSRTANHPPYEPPVRLGRNRLEDILFIDSEWDTFDGSPIALLGVGHPASRSLDD